MPVGPFKDFAACVKAQMAKGRSKDSANKICGEIEKRTRNQRMKDWRKFNFVVPIKERFTIENKLGEKEFLIRGTAINETTTKNNIKYTAEELSKAAATLRNKPILKNHSNDVDDIVGRTTNNIMFNETSKTLDFEGRIVDEAMQKKIEKGLITSVSVGGVVEDLVEEEDESVKAIGIEFLELSLVAIPADPQADFRKAIFESMKIKKKLKESESTSMVWTMNSNSTTGNVITTESTGLSDFKEQEDKKDGEEEDGKKEEESTVKEIIIKPKVSIKIKI